MVDSVINLASQVKVLRSKRRSFSIKVNRDLSIEVRVPLRFKDGDLPPLLAKHQGWIEKKKYEMMALPPVVPIVFASGHEVPVLGVSHRIEVTLGKRAKCVQTAGMLMVTVRELSDREVYRVVLKWYREYAREVVEQCVRGWATDFSVDYQSVRIKSMTSRWGSCSSNRLLNFNWRLVMAPMEVLEYVVVHELCHLLEMNHGPRFWAEVRSRVPRFKDHVQWLKVNGDSLMSVSV
jgi:predicted metal-dependent hydrolase